MTKRKTKDEEAIAPVEKIVERSSFSPAEIAERNNVDPSTVYRAMQLGLLKSSNLGTGKRGAIRITLEQEKAWHQLGAEIASLQQHEKMGAPA